MDRTEGKPRRTGQHVTRTIVCLPPHMDRQLDEVVSRGVFVSRSAVVRAALESYLRAHPEGATA